MSHFEAAENSIKVWQSRVAEQTSDKPAGTIVQADKTGIYVATGNGVLVLEQLQVPGKNHVSSGYSELTCCWFEVGTLLV